MVSPDGADGSVTVHQDVRLFSAVLDAGRTLEHPIAPGRKAWVQIATGKIALGEIDLQEGDGAAVEGESLLTIRGLEDATVLVFDLA